MASTAVLFYCAPAVYQHNCFVVPQGRVRFFAEHAAVPSNITVLWRMPWKMRSRQGRRGQVLRSGRLRRFSSIGHGPLLTSAEAPIESNSVDALSLQKLNVTFVFFSHTITSPRRRHSYKRRKENLNNGSIFSFTENHRVVATKQKGQGHL